MLINVENLEFSINGTRILDCVHLHVESNQIYGLVGPNGAGKSTTIAVILGLYQADCGKLELFGEIAGKPSPEIKRRIGVLPEDSGFYGWMNAPGYLAWYAGLYGGPQRSIPDLLSQVGLAGLDKRPIRQFSRGMRQRLGLARALVNNPRLIILDEPTNGLDPRGRREMHDLLRTIVREQGVGILLCTHLLDDVDRLCDRIGVIDRGRTVLESPLVELLARHNGGRNYRLRLEISPKESELPIGTTLLGQSGGWWHLHLGADVSPAELWRHLIEIGWGVTEIHAEGSGLEELYMQLTSASQKTVREQEV